MKTVLLFKKNDWNTSSISSYLDQKHIQYELRSGFTHILAVCNLFNPFNLRKADKNIICVLYNKIDNSASAEAIIVGPNGINKISLDILLKGKNNVQFDLFNFGYVPKGSAKIEQIYDKLKVIKPSSQIDFLKICNCDDIIYNSKVPDEIKKSVLDVFALIAAQFQINIKLHGYDILSQYSCCLALTFVLRAKIEKLMLLVAQIDNTFDYKQLINAKRIRTKFLKEAPLSQLPITKRLNDFVQNVDLLDEKFRTPEAHKMGRLLSLLYNEAYGSILNELLSYTNESNHIFKEVVNFIKEKYIE